MIKSGYDFWKDIDTNNIFKTVKELAEESGVNYIRIRNQRSDNRIPCAEDLYNLSKALHVTMEYLLTGEDCKLSPEAQFVESNPEMKTLVRYCMNDGRLLLALQLIVEQARIEGEKKIHA